MTTEEQIKDLQERVQKLHRCVDIDTKRQAASEMTDRTLQADFWDDPKEAEAFQ